MINDKMLDYLEQGRMAAIRSISLAPIASNEMSFGEGHTSLNQCLDDIITIAKTLLPQSILGKGS